MAGSDDAPSQRSASARHRTTAVAVLVVSCWIVITVGIAFGYARATEPYQYLTVLVGLICTQLWGPTTHRLQ